MSDPELPERDPLADLVSRGVGTRVESVEAEPIAGDDDVERKRLWYQTPAGRTSVVFERSPKRRTLEAQLLPFLARKTDRVPAVHARGLPPPHASLGPWVLVEDVLRGPPACDGDPVDVLRAKLAIERATARDLPALRALGLRERAEDIAALRTARVGLVHGALVCGNALRVDRGVVLVGWAQAFLGPTVLDAATLVADLKRRGMDDAAARARDAYVAEGGDVVGSEWLSATDRGP